MTPETYAALEADNFSGRAFPEVVDFERLKRDLREYRPELGPVNRDLAVGVLEQAKDALLARARPA